MAPDTFQHPVVGRITSRFSHGLLLVLLHQFDVRLTLRPLPNDQWSILALRGPKMIFQGKVDTNGRHLLLSLLLFTHPTTPPATQADGLELALQLVGAIDAAYFKHGRAA